MPHFAVSYRCKSRARSVGSPRNVLPYLIRPDYTEATHAPIIPPEVGLDAESRLVYTAYLEDVNGCRLRPVTIR